MGLIKSQVVGGIAEFFSTLSLSDYIGAFFALLAGIASFYSANVSRRIEKGIEKITDIQSYNRSREKMAKELRECKLCLEDMDVEIDLTNASKIQASIHKMKQYPKVFNAKEQKKLDEILNLIRLGEYTTIERTIMLEAFNCFIAKLEKGDIII